MGYLVCNKCGGSYELQKGESPEDFSDVCECGGNLKYNEKIHHKTDSADRKKIVVCPKCGHENVHNDKFCGTCGETLLMEKTSFKSIFDNLNFNIILIGSFITILALIITKILLFDVVSGQEPVESNFEKAAYTLIYVIILVMGCFIAGTFNRLNYKTAALYGVVIMILPAIFFWLSELGFYKDILSLYVSSPLEDISVSLIFVVVTVILVLIYALLGSLGTILGVFVNKKLKLNEKSIWMKFEEYINRINSDQWKFGYISFFITILSLIILSEA